MGTETVKFPQLRNGSMDRYEIWSDVVLVT